MDLFNRVVRKLQFRNNFRRPCRMLVYGEAAWKPKFPENPGMTNGATAAKGADMYMFKKAYLTVVLILAAVPFSFGQTSDDAVSLLYEIDDRSTKFGDEITFIEEFNFGIPGGKNWLVEWEEEMTIEHGEERLYRISMIYVVDVDLRKILFREQFDAVINLKEVIPTPHITKTYPGKPLTMGDFRLAILTVKALI